MCQPRYFLLPCEIFNFMSPRASALCTARHPRGPEITVPLAKWCNYTEMAKERKKKNWTRLLCRFKFRNRREERDNSRVSRRKSYSRGKRVGGESGVCFAGFTRSECLHLPKTVWDDCMWVLFFFPWPWWCENEERFRAVLTVRGSRPCLLWGSVCSQIVAPVLNYEKQTAVGHVKFSQDNHSFSESKRSIQLKSKTERDGQKDGEKKKKKGWQISRAQTNRRCDGVMEWRCCACCRGGTILLLPRI